MKAVTDSELLAIGYRYAYALAANRQDAEDLLHDAWIRLISRYGESPDKPLLFRTIKNLFIDKVRHNNVVSNYAHSQVETQITTDVALDSLINAELLEYHLDKLKSNEREVLFLSVVEGYTADEISAMTGKVRGTILSLLSRTKKKLRKSMSNVSQGSFDETANEIAKETASDAASAEPHGKSGTSATKSGSSATNTKVNTNNNVINMKRRRVR